jgi:hypothetical protein
VGNLRSVTPAGPLLVTAPESAIARHSESELSGQTARQNVLQR